MSSMCPKDGTSILRVSKQKMSKRRLSSRSLENKGQAAEFDTDHDEGSSCKQCTLCMVYVVDQAYMNSRASSHHRRGNAGRSRHDQSTPKCLDVELGGLAYSKIRRPGREAKL